MSDCPAVLPSCRPAARLVNELRSRQMAWRITKWSSNCCTGFVTLVTLFSQNSRACGMNQFRAKECSYHKQAVLFNSYHNNTTMWMSTLLYLVARGCSAEGQYRVPCCLFLHLGFRREHLYMTLYNYGPKTDHSSCRYIICIGQCEGNYFGCFHIFLCGSECNVAIYVTLYNV